MALTYPPYDSYDGFGRSMSRSMSRSLSRRQSLSYPNQAYSYDQNQMFGDSMLDNVCFSPTRGPIRHFS